MDMDLDTLRELRDAVNLCLAELQTRDRASDARRRLESGSSRAKVTSANARWATKCEAYERTRKSLIERMRRLSCQEE